MLTMISRKSSKKRLHLHHSLENSGIAVGREILLHKKLRLIGIKKKVVKTSKLAPRSGLSGLINKWEKKMFLPKMCVVRSKRKG